MFTQTYASHCMQTALEMANSFLADRIDEPADALAQRKDGEPLESLLDLVNLFVENVLPRLSVVCCDVNGSHVLRSLLCVLLGCANADAAVKKHIVKGALARKVPPPVLVECRATQRWWRRSTRRAAQCCSPSRRCRRPTANSSWRTATGASSCRCS